MVDYLIDTKFIFDSFATIYFPILDVDFVEYVIDGLGAKYQSFITNLHFWSSTTFDDSLGAKYQSSNGVICQFYIMLTHIKKV